MRLKIASLGFGAVGRAVVEMLVQKEQVLREEHQLQVVFTGALTRRAGGWVAPEGLTPKQLLDSGWPQARGFPPGTEPFTRWGLDFARHGEADVLLELTTLSPMDGEPAISHIRAALEARRHVVTANKGPIAHAYRELRALARERGCQLRFESTVMDGTPIFHLRQECLPATEVLGFEGVLNSTSNYILGRLAAGESLAQALAGAQRLGIAEANPAYDLEGWDASVKATVLANVLMGAELTPAQVRREDLSAEAMQRAEVGRTPEQTLKQVVEVRREGGRVVARIRLLALPPTSLFSRLQGMEAALLLHTDTLGDLTLVEGEGGPGQTAFGVIADLVQIARLPGQSR